MHLAASTVLTLSNILSASLIFQCASCIAQASAGPIPQSPDESARSDGTFITLPSQADSIGMTVSRSNNPALISGIKRSVEVTDIEAGHRDGPLEDLNY
ncbi:hypothetical protein DFP72DRAFT_938173 [Ephemerocybe angulata]|uniref:Uncharacterized protein n=1 Tax=Ephemerocybe angulata TaxID=980116 RepID=A0A8H6H8Q0_9AGAR|nr:hypothetical protein DFP72DRAFT_938173 [Tulosesus angulatus]